MMKRPLSPHLQIYRLPLTAILSITHRLTGVFLSFCHLFLLPLWLWGVWNQYVFPTYTSYLLIPYVFSFFYHMGNGLRYLLWSFGLGFDLKTAYFTGWSVVIFAFLATFIVGVWL